MNGILDFTTLIFMVLAVVIFWRLRSVLGKRTGNEPPPPRPVAPREAQADNVISLSRAPKAPANDEADQGLDKIAPSGSALNNALRAIISADRNFDAEYFITGAKAAYEMIVGAFAAGDRESLKPLLEKDVYEGFAAAITDREKRGEVVTSTFVGIDRADIVEAAMKGSMAQVSIRFVSKLISVTHDSTGAVVDGDPAKVIEVTDVWTFDRDTRSRDPNWKLVATEAEG